MKLLEKLDYLYRLTNDELEFFIDSYSDTEKHFKNKTYGDKPYMYHIDEVITKTVFLNEDYDLSLLLVALDHDTVEDCDVDREYLYKVKGYSEEVVDGIYAISKRDDETRKEYLQRCMKNTYTHKVKIADTTSNFEHSVKDGNARRVGKYSKQIDILTVKN